MFPQAWELGQNKAVEGKEGEGIERTYKVMSIMWTLNQAEGDTEKDGGGESVSVSESVVYCG